MRNINKENPHFIFNNVDGYIKENNGFKYLFYASTDKSKKY